MLSCYYYSQPEPKVGDSLGDTKEFKWVEPKNLAINKILMLSFMSQKIQTSWPLIFASIIWWAVCMSLSQINSWMQNSRLNHANWTLHLLILIAKLESYSTLVMIDLTLLNHLLFCSCVLGTCWYILWSFLSAYAFLMWACK